MNLRYVGKDRSQLRRRSHPATYTGPLVGAARRGKDNYRCTPRGREDYWRVLQMGKVTQILLRARPRMEVEARTVAAARAEAYAVARAAVGSILKESAMDVDKRVQDALEVTASILMDPTADPKDRLAAARLILDNLHIKPSQRRNEGEKKSPEELLLEAAREAGIEVET